MQRKIKLNFLIMGTNITISILFYIKFMNQPVQTALAAVGDHHKYQKMLIVFLLFIVAEANYLMVGPTFIFMNPLFDCPFANGQVNEFEACDHLDVCKISNSFTIVAHLQLYCEKQSQRNIIQSILPIGSIFGLFISSFTSDRKGRKFALIMVQIVSILGMGLTLIGGYISELWVLIIAQFLCGFSGFSLMSLAFFIPTQFCQQQFRQRAVIAVNYAWSGTSVILGILFYYYNQWDNFLLFVVLIPMGICLLITFFYLVEGPYFLYGQNKQEQCLKSLKFIANINGKKDQFQKVTANFKLQALEQHKQEPLSLLQILKNKTYLRMAIILAVAESGVNIYYFGTNYALDDIGYDYGANMIASGLIQLAAFILLSFIITKVPRKKGLLTLHSIIVAMGMLFFILPIRNSKIASMITLGFIRFFLTVAFTIILILLTQTFPINVQATITGIIEGIAQLGSFLGPIVITFCINLQVYPIIVLSFILLTMVVFPLTFMKGSRSQADDLKESLIEKDDLYLSTNENRDQ